MQLTLISLYYYVCEWYNSTLRWQVQRFSNNSYQGHITDEEIITIYLFCVSFQEKIKLKSMHKYILNHWQSWFPVLYTTKNSLFNNLSLCTINLANRLKIGVINWSIFVNSQTNTKSIIYT